ncbi:hypothetical protein PCL_06063 [Purpureocillium lilacinum]|uniref:Uncharacterized protein n=1 Tax=Purpureocillium lilacinum TaxID=33203 RepID=A0A2U3ELM5_PURLI|nr:hypothetical protein Purlil1_9093 [Purpureocillium lilacinum]PWI75405.1 hypothetical protein PCL_06063 [Purpureocillium lilacinum]
MARAVANLDKACPAWAIPILCAFPSNPRKQSQKTCQQTPSATFVENICTKYAERYEATASTSRGEGCQRDALNVLGGARNPNQQWTLPRRRESISRPLRFIWARHAAEAVSLHGAEPVRQVQYEYDGKASDIAITDLLGRDILDTSGRSTRRATNSTPVTRHGTGCLMQEAMQEAKGRWRRDPPRSASTGNPPAGRGQMESARALGSTRAHVS